MLNRCEPFEITSPKLLTGWRSNGRVAAVLISPEDLLGLEETLSVLSDPEALADIREADAAYHADDVVRGVEAVRQLRR